MLQSLKLFHGQQFLSKEVNLLENISVVSRIPAHAFSDIIKTISIFPLLSFWNIAYFLMITMEDFKPF